MLDFNVSQVITEYLLSQGEIFTADDLYYYLKSKGIKTTKSEVFDLLRTSDLVFPLINKEFITRTGVFEGRWFSFKPSKEEVEKGYFILGHRCMPFTNPEVSPDNIEVYSNKKTVKPARKAFTMNLALDTFALFGEGYVLPYVINDKANEKVSLSQVQYNLPPEITLTCWPLKEITGEEKFEYGDRILCRVLDWTDSLVEMQVQKSELNNFVISDAAIQREAWYSIFENGLLESFDRNGPSTSIEMQLAYLFLENQDELCTKNCGSAEEFLHHTKKIGFSPYGVETRIWRTGESVPYVGKWNEEFSDELMMSDMSMTLTPQILDAYLEDMIYQNKTTGKKEDVEALADTLLEEAVHLTSAQRKLLLLNIEKRHDILKQNYNQFADYGIATVRKRILELFTKVNSMVTAIGCSRVKVDDFPQQELVILSQLFSHIAHLLEEVENPYLRDQFPVSDVNLSLDGMEETFEDIVYTLKSALDRIKYSGFEILK